MIEFPERIPRQDSAFTLVELLVVIAIIALLISMLLPSLGRAREQSKLSRCLANMRDLVSAGYAYAGEDPGENLVPVHSRFAEIPAGVTGPESSAGYLSAARRAFGGKSGRHDYREVISSSFWGSATVVGRYSTANGMGPATRPLNRYLFKAAIADRSHTTLEEMRKDEHLEFEVFRCPSEVGYRPGLDGATGAYLGMGVRYTEQDSQYNTMGSSYGTDGVIYGSGDPQTQRLVTAIGAWLRPYTQVPSTSRTTLLIETNGFYAIAWNSSVGIGPADPEMYTFGNHGRRREHVTAFVDGHAAPVLYEIRTDAYVSGGEVRHSGDFVLKGGRIEPLPPPGVNTPDNASLADLAHLIYFGDGWQNHCFPAPGVRAGARY